MSQTDRDDNEHDEGDEKKEDDESGEEDDRIAVTRHHFKIKDVANVMTTRRKSRSIGEGGHGIGSSRGAE